MTWQRCVCVEATGLVTSVGLSAASTCAAIRAKLSNAAQTRLVPADEGWLVAHQVALEQPWRGLDKLASMAAMAIDECLEAVSSCERPVIPLLLCVAEPQRAGRIDDLDRRLFDRVGQWTGLGKSDGSGVIAQGRPGLITALHRARALLRSGRASRVLLAGTDSLLTWPVYRAYLDQQRLLTPLNSDGLMLGEAAGALLLTAGSGPSLRLCGIGTGIEPAKVDSGMPLRAQGLKSAIEAALAEAGVALHQMDWRVTDLSGEHYYFKEAALAVGRLLRAHKESFELWHPAQSVGETGAAAGFVGVAVADAAYRKAYAPGPWVLVHLGNDEGQRAAAVFGYGSVR
ncbi:hypothetical protein [Azohydromonas caseinilytica]|uniref:3-oxoacyl-[acyl-carrier-protein] synthase-1 n=1 Tax=Azohydromonas caseinilytica TaxID=2728836 RepID=A0A848FE27_9BURK|nr:hypothetical protein [Azohydromonas caseinilytica]NML16533.1 hypothetical protein [Azohydromonas caseinilytica]